ncbi:hypothetical protein CPC08DRAFT_705655 [Agrocybe pediades]|nr:hypothetical protein CPC08DRAFT_705655 [Agrocybe pediades]
MDRLRAQTEARRATIASATKRAAAAEQTVALLESALQEKNRIAIDLQKRIELTRQSKQLSKELLTTLQKLDEATSK